MRRAVGGLVAVGLLLLPGAVVAGAAITSTLGTTAVAGDCGPGGAAEQVSGQALDAEQLASARTIVETTAASRMPRRAAQIALATAFQESSLRNITHGDRDSLGLFQQRPSQGWGTAAEILDPVHATRSFLAALERVDGWPSMPLTVAAQSVQRSALPDAYAKFESAATALTQRFWPPGGGPGGSDGPAAQSGPPSGPPSAAATAPVAAAAWRTACTGGDGIPHGAAVSPGGGVPAGYVPPTDAQQARAVAFALAQVGEPYVWGGTGPDGWDCSGLMLKAWAAAGVGLPRTTFAQVHAGTPVSSLASVEPGDLLFIAGSDGSATNPGHVGMAIGTVRGVPYLVHAPQSGRPVTVRPLSAWSGLIVAIRRPGRVPRLPA